MGLGRGSAGVGMDAADAVMRRVEEEAWRSELSRAEQEPPWDGGWRCVWAVPYMVWVLAGGRPGDWLMGALGYRVEAIGHRLAPASQSLWSRWARAGRGPRATSTYPHNRRRVS